jgi:hypothetical protein
VRKVLQVLIVSLSLPCVAWATCCSTISSGPTAWVPVFSKTGCVGQASKATYGGTANIKTDNTYLYQTSVTHVAKLWLAPVGADPSFVASRLGTTGLGCNTTTTVATWTQTVPCVCVQGYLYYSGYSITTAPCQTMASETTTVTSGFATAP